VQARRLLLFSFEKSLCTEAVIKVKYIQTKESETPGGQAPVLFQQGKYFTRFPRFCSIKECICTRYMEVYNQIEFCNFINKFGISTYATYFRSFYYYTLFATCLGRTTIFMCNIYIYIHRKLTILGRYLPS
jgi:hypothetical protein